MSCYFGLDIAFLVSGFLSLVYFSPSVSETTGGHLPPHVAGFHGVFNEEIISMITLIKTNDSGELGEKKNKENLCALIN